MPAIQKTLIYLDTSTISNMAKAIHRGDETSIWTSLYRALRGAAADELVSCPDSSVVRDEAELSTLGEPIVRLARELGSVRLNHEVAIREAQLSRALKHWLAQEPATLDAKPPARDAFRKDPHRWLPNFSVSVGLATPPEVIAERRRSKESSVDEFARIYEECASAGDDFETIRNNEARGYGRGTVTVGLRALRRRFGIDPVGSEFDAAADWLPNEFDKVAYFIRQKLGLSFADSLERAKEFLLSDHAAATPYAECNARLHGAVALLCRGPSPRRPRPSDFYDLDHIATHTPYVDVLITDTFFADLCNQGHVRVGSPYGTVVRSLRPSEVSEFIAWLEGLRPSSPHAALARRVHDCISAGGYMTELLEKMRAFLRSRGIDPP